MFLFRLPNLSILDKTEIFSIKTKRACKKLVCSLLKINWEFSFYMKLPATLFYMTWEQENYILEWSRKYKLNIKLIALVFDTDNRNIWRFQWLENILPCITFAIQYFSQKTSNNTQLNHFLPGNIQDNINTFNGNQIDFFCKILHPWKIREYPLKLNPSLNKKE